VGPNGAGYFQRIPGRGDGFLKTHDGVLAIQWPLSPVKVPRKLLYDRHLGIDISGRYVFNREAVIKGTLEGT
jgi:hypothetical protein